jgi:hypothetical protein
MVTSAAAPIENPVKGRKSFLLKYKQFALNAINDLMLLGYSLRNATEKVNIPHIYLFLELEKGGWEGQSTGIQADCCSFQDQWGKLQDSSWMSQ